MFWPPHCSPSSSASCSVRQKRICQTAFTSVSEQTAVYSTFGVSSHARKPIEELITELLFADDCALLAHTEEALQHIVNRFSDATKNFGLTISLKKTEVLYQPPPQEAYSPHSSIDGTNQMQWNTSRTWVASSPMMPQSAMILTTTFPKPAVPSEDC